MIRYRVRDGAILPHHGALLEGGAILELPRHVGEDPAVRHLVQPVDDRGVVIALPPYDAAIDGFRPHEQVTILKNRMVATQDLLNRLEADDQPAAPQTAAARPDAPDEER